MFSYIINLKWNSLISFIHFSLLHAAVEHRKKDIVSFLLSVDGIDKNILNQVLLDLNDILTFFHF